MVHERRINPGGQGYVAHRRVVVTRVRIASELRRALPPSSGAGQGASRYAPLPQMGFAPARGHRLVRHAVRRRSVADARPKAPTAAVSTMAKSRHMSPVGLALAPISWSA